ncbi:hypothetical protein HWV62_25928 [Athelia sp. TMB]|nr:hypothetical protein HWV62_25928 [Athelia sp. TMB]
MTEIITLYDIPSKLPNKAWSPNTWKARLALNIKGLPYRTIWVEYPDIASVCSQLGAKPSGPPTPSGELLYGLPVIHDPKHNAVISNSIDIARYLDDKYPETAPLLPKGTDALFEAFQEAYVRLALTHLYPLITLVTCNNLNSASEQYFRTGKQPQSGETFEEVAPKGAAREELWKKKREGHEIIAGWFEKNGGGNFVMGKQISYADIILAAWLIWPRLEFGEDSEEWKAVLAWQGGWWARYLAQFDQYLQVI